jgi:hypothetical protein
MSRGTRIRVVVVVVRVVENEACACRANRLSSTPPYDITDLFKVDNIKVQFWKLLPHIIQ